MNIRPLLLGLPLLLTGCSASSGFSWSSLSPFNWFGNSLEVSSKGVGNITAGTPMKENVIAEALGNNYQLRRGMMSNNGSIVSYYQVLDGSELKLLVIGEPEGKVQRVEVTDKKVETEWGTALGMPFSKLFSKAYGACKAGEGDDVGKVVCIAEQSSNVRYIFTGQWAGPQDIIPPDDTLQHWTVSKIIWQATTA